MSTAHLVLMMLGATSADAADGAGVPSLLPYYSLQQPVSTAAWASVPPGLERMVGRQGEGKQWEFEITPYVWLAGVDAEVEVGNLKADVDVGFGDILEKLDGGGALLATGKFDRFVYWAQVDHYDFGDDSSRFDFDLEQTIATGAAGWEFDGPFEGSKLGVLGGLRWTRLEADLEIGAAHFDRTTNLVDMVVMLRPDIRFGEKWRFNPAMSVGVGDSELTYELWPQIQYQITERIAARLGYRRLYYRTDNGTTEFDGSLAGLMFGLGVTF